jgi:hypothetical protein
VSTAFKQRQYDLAYDDGTDCHWGHLARNWIVLQEIGKFSPISLRVLDVGFGRGIVVKYLCVAGVACVALLFFIAIGIYSHAALAMTALMRAPR